MFYVFHGEDEFTRAEELARLRARVMADGVGELNITGYDGRSLSIAELINSCNTLPFFSERRLIVVTDMLQQYEKRASGHTAEEATRLVNYLPSLPETTRLVFDESLTLSSDKGVLHAVRALPNGYVREFPRLNPNRRDEAERLRQWIGARARSKGVEIEPAAVARLIESVGSDLRQMDTELDKLAGRVNYGRDIRAEDVVDLVTPNPETRVYEMLDSMGMRARSQALTSLHRLLGTDPRFADGLYPLAMIAIRFGELLTIKDLSESQRLSDSQVRSAMKMQEWRHRRLRDQARLFSSEELVRLIHQALEIDRGIKTGAVDPVLSIEMLLIEATRRSAHSPSAQRERNRSRIR